MVRLALSLALLFGAAGCAAETCSCGEFAFERRSTIGGGEDVMPGTKTETTSSGAEHRQPTRMGTKTESTRTETSITRPTETGWCSLSISVPPNRNACAV